MTQCAAISTQIFKLGKLKSFDNQQRKNERSQQVSCPSEITSSTEAFVESLLHCSFL